MRSGTEKGSIGLVSRRRSRLADAEAERRRRRLLHARSADGSAGLRIDGLRGDVAGALADRIAVAVRIRVVWRRCDARAIYLRRWGTARDALNAAVWPSRRTSCD